MTPAEQVANAVNHPLLDPHKTLRLITTSTRVAAWLQAGASIELIVATVSAVMKLRPRNDGPVRTWSYFDEPIRRAITDKQEMEKFDATISSGPAVQRAKRSRAADSVLAEFDELERPRAATG